MIVFCTLLREFRKRARYTQKELAQKIAMSFNHLNQVENGKRSAPRREKVMALARILQLNEEETDRFLIAGGYAPEPRESKIPLISDQSESLLYESPFEEKESQVASVSSEKPRQMSIDISNPIIRLVAETISDTTIQEDQRKQIEREIRSFVEWQRYRAKREKRN